MSTRSTRRHGTGRRYACAKRNGAAGFSLIELMVAMLLGLIVIAGVVSVFLATQRSYRTSTALGDVQDGSRIAFELMAHDIRDAGLSGCTNNNRVGDTLNNGPAAGGTVWWANWSNAIHGYDSSSSPADPAPASGTVTQVANSQSLMLLGTADLGVTVYAHVDATNFTVNPSTSATFQAGDVAVVCDPTQAAIFQITKYTAGTVNTIEHAVAGSPGNCSQGLDYRTVCTTVGNAHQYRANAQVAELTAVDWYLGTNAVGGTSLYRMSLVNTGGVPTPTSFEMVRDVTAMDLTYLQVPNQSFVTASKVTNWSAVNAVQISLQLQSTNKTVGTAGNPITRPFTATTTLRNRVN